MKCPYCGNDDHATFMYPDDDDGPYVVCLACNGEFEQEEVEYYKKQSEEGEQSGMKCPKCDDELVDYGDGLSDLFFCEGCKDQFTLGEVQAHQEQSIALSAIIQVLDKEIEWCNNNRGTAPGPDGDWFIKGLTQARYLIIELSRVKEDDPLANKPEETEELFPEISTSLDDLPKNLKWLRKIRGLTLKEVGEKTGLSASFLSDMERGKTRPSLETLRKLAVVYGTPISINLSAIPSSIEETLNLSYAKVYGWMGDVGGIPHGPFDV